MSRQRRFLVDGIADRVVLRGDEAHHLRSVLRLGAGDAVVLFDGRGRAAEAVVTRMGRDAVELEVRGDAPTGESALSLTVGVAVLKADRMALVVQKLTELGVTAILPLATDRGEVPAERARKSLDRWRRIAMEACKQSGRSRLPELAEPQSLEETLSSGSAPAVALAAHPGSPPLVPSDRRGPMLALLGPEGGWSETELEAMQGAGVRLFGLGPRTLRAETAAIVATALLQWSAGDLAGDY